MKRDEKTKTVQLRRTLGQIYFKPKFKEIDGKLKARCMYCGGYNTVRKGKSFGDANTRRTQRYICYSCKERTFTYPNDKFFTKD